MSQHPDFFDKSIEEPDLEPLPEDIWAVSIKDPEGEVSASPDAPHEWVFLKTVPYISDRTSGPEPPSPLYRYQCRRCGLETVCSAWENLEDDTDSLKESCTEILLRNTHEE